MGKTLNFLKSHLLLVAYCAAGVLTAILAISLIVWAAMGDRELIAEVRPATLVMDEGVQREYLVGQTVNTQGISINIGTDEKPEIIPAANCTVNADFKSAGKNTVEISYRVNDLLSYSAVFESDVIFVRNVEIVKYPHLVTVGEGNSITCDDNFEIYATLATAPKSGVFGEVKATANGYRVKLSESAYEAACVPDKQVENLYAATFYCGDVQASFNFYNAAGRSFIVSSAKEIVNYELESGDEGAALTLIVTDRAEGYQRTCTGTTEGYYIYRDGAGEEEVYGFSYELTDTAEVFGSEDIDEGTRDNYYTAAKGGNKFRADAAVWQSAVVNGSIFDDHGFKVVVDSARRILNFDLEQSGGEDNKPTLTLYTCFYDLNPLLGTGNGYAYGVYIFTDEDGNSYKAPFYMQVWVWTFVPLSSSRTEANYSDISVDDIIYNKVEDEYNSFVRGDLITTVTVFSRGEGFKQIRFIAPEENWLGSIMGM